MRIIFFDVGDLHGGKLVVDDDSKTIISFGAINEADGSSAVAYLNHMQVSKLRSILSDWLGRNIGNGKPLWEER